MSQKPADPLASLRSALHDRRALMVAGTGVSIAATWDAAAGGPHPQASWAGLIRHGLQHARTLGQVPEKKVQALLDLLDASPGSEDLISAATAVTKGLGGATSSIFEKWLANTIGTITARDRSLLDAIEALRAHGNQLATTNYDDLLLCGSLAAVHWRQSAEFLSAFRERDASKVIFLHGHWRHPESVILDWRSYHDIARDTVYREDLLAVWKTLTWVYVGCGTDGLDDPDLGLLLGHHGSRARDLDHWDFCLVDDLRKADFQEFFDRNKINILAVGYGPAHSDLPGFLHSLIPTPAPAASLTPAPAPTAAPAPYTPPPFFAARDYIPGHPFLGRAAQLDILSDWASPSDPTTLLLFEAIGGNGKSALTWHWTKERAPVVRRWAGRFWYSFYEKGADMADFCRHALAYLTGEPQESFRLEKTAALAPRLLQALHGAPYLFILDGLERVLVHYHRLDAAERAEDEADAPTDPIARRDPCAAIRPEDDDLLRALAGAAPSKVLASSRLMPRVLLNAASQPIPGARRIDLPGLRPADAEALLRSTGCTGDSDAIQRYLQENCDCHPLVIGVLGGLILGFRPARGDFDAWVRAPGPAGGQGLDLGALNLVQRRNHILHAALAALGPDSRALLSLLALLPEPVDYATLQEFPIAALDASLDDLEKCGLVHYDHPTRRYDLHPVVRAVALTALAAGEKETLGGHVVDHFSSQAHSPYDEAQTLDDVRVGLNLVRTYIRLGRMKEAAMAYVGDLSRALHFNLEAFSETVALLRPFFPGGWGRVPAGLPDRLPSYLANEAAIALEHCGEPAAALEAHGAALRVNLQSEEWRNVLAGFSNSTLALDRQNRLAAVLRVDGWAQEIAERRGGEQDIFIIHLDLFYDHAQTGQWAAAEASWAALHPMGRDWFRAAYRPGYAEHLYALCLSWRGRLTEADLATAERLAATGNNRTVVRYLHQLRGAWRLEQGAWAAAALSFAEAVRLARERALPCANVETGLALAQYHLGTLADPRAEAERLARTPGRHERWLARLWHALGEPEQARTHALAAYRWAWADGEPYVRRYELEQAAVLLAELGVPVPALRPYDRAQDPKLPWEDEVVAAIEKLRAEDVARAAETEAKKSAPGANKAAQGANKPARQAKKAPRKAQE